MTSRRPGPGLLGFPPVVGAAAGAVAAEGECLKPFFDLAAVGVGELEGQKDRLGCDAADAAGARRLDALGQWVLGVAVVALDAVAEPEIDLLPFRGRRTPEPPVGTARRNGRMRERPWRVSTPAAATMTVMGSRSSKSSTNHVDLRRPMTRRGTFGLGWVRARKFVTVLVPRL